MGSGPPPPFGPGGPGGRGPTRRGGRGEKGAKNWGEGGLALRVRGGSGGEKGGKTAGDGRSRGVGEPGEGAAARARGEIWGPAGGKGGKKGPGPQGAAGQTRPERLLVTGGTGPKKRGWGGKKTEGTEGTVFGNRTPPKKRNPGGGLGKTLPTNTGKKGAKWGEGGGTREKKKRGAGALKRGRV